MAKAGAGVYSTARHQRARKALLGQPCSWPGCRDIATTVDHNPPLALHHHMDDGMCCELRPMCAHHNYAAGTAIANARRRARADRAAGFLSPSQSTHSAVTSTHPQDEADLGGMSPDEARTIPWLRTLAKVPREATWPRLMTSAHPRAVGSYGPAFARWVKREVGWTLWWWQKLASTRVLEHDSDGQLVWPVAGLSTSRQVGKSRLSAALAMWRIAEGSDLFGEEQSCLHVAKDLVTARLVQRPMRRLGREFPELYKVRENGVQVSIEHLGTGSVWELRAADSSYGHSGSMVLVDEAWSIKADLIDDALLPTLAQRLSPQLLLVSTANARSTSLMIDRRAGALAELSAPTSTLWLEWSASPPAELDDIDAWREASPQWDARRRQAVMGAYTSAVSIRSADVSEGDPLMSFATQWLDRWPATPNANVRGEPVVDLDEWRAAEDDDSPDDPTFVIAVEDNYGADAAVAVASAHDDGRIYLECELCDSRAEALDRARELIESCVGSRVVVGASLVRDPLAVELGAKPVGRKETAAALPLLRSLLGAGRLVHSRSDALTEQLASVRVVRGATGALTLTAGARSDAVRASVWALHEVELNPPVRPQIW